jgi:hypothetical protein
VLLVPYGCVAVEQVLSGFYTGGARFISAETSIFLAEGFVFFIDVTG